MLLQCLVVHLVVLIPVIHGYQYQVKKFTVPVDHFSFGQAETFAIRYLINDTHWDNDTGPIFFYTGNEGDIELFANNTGFMWEIAPHFQALVVFAEHRYYGQSMPFGNKSFSEPKYTGYLTSQQALADYADLLTELTAGSKRRVPVVAFGGSYGGMLAAYMRLKYPHIISGAIAASAPIWQFTGLTPCDAFGRIVTADFALENQTCSDAIRKSWEAINRVTSAGDGLAWLSKAWRLCEPLKSPADVQVLKDWLTNVYTNLAMVNYPYPSGFLAPLPGYPIREVCRHLNNTQASDKDLLKQIFNGVSVYTNYTGTTKCINIADADSDELGAQGWEYQSCTEMVMPMCTDGQADMFEKNEWDLSKYSDECYGKWKVRPQPYLAEETYGGKRIRAASNIIFSNGLLDPWSSGGVLKDLSKTLVSVVIPEGAHHLDLRESNPADPPSVRQARKMYQRHIRTWIQDPDS